MTRISIATLLLSACLGLNAQAATSPQSHVSTCSVVEIGNGSVLTEYETVTTESANGLHSYTVTKVTTTEGPNSVMVGNTYHRDLHVTRQVVAEAHDLNFSQWLSAARQKTIVVDRVEGTYTYVGPANLRESRGSQTLQLLLERIEFPGQAPQFLICR